MMESLAETIRSVLSKLAQCLGIKPTEEQRLYLTEERLARARADNVDRLEQVKEEVRKLEARALRKKQEYDAAQGPLKRIAARELEQVFRDLDRVEGRERIILRNIEKLSVAQAKLEELKVARAEGLGEDLLDDLALDLEEALDALKAADRATRDLEETKYVAPESQSVDVEKRMTELVSPEDAGVRLPEAARERLARLEAESEEE